tara:strand:- start:317 stop:697 length:381 start_codon:yes stop_codon:yes gene_type:complete
MIWKKKLREYKGTNYYYSLRNKLKREKKIDDHFEILLNGLTIEELIGLKLEIASSHANNRLYGFPILSAMRSICEEACIRYAASACKTTVEAALFLGIDRARYLNKIKKFNIRKDLIEEQNANSDG